MRPSRLTESHCDPRKHAFGFGIMNGWRIVGSLGMAGDADSRAKIARKRI
jgi:hypothetical protein